MRVVTLGAVTCRTDMYTSMIAADVPSDVLGGEASAKLFNTHRVLPDQQNRGMKVLSTHPDVCTRHV